MEIVITLVLVIGLFVYFWLPRAINKRVKEYEHIASCNRLIDDLDVMIDSLKKEDKTVYYTTLHTMN